LLLLLSAISVYKGLGNKIHIYFLALCELLFCEHILTKHINPSDYSEACLWFSLMLSLDWVQG